MTNHTPGPWRTNGTLIEGPKMALTVANVPRPHLGTAPMTDEEAKANARLIAAAPDMLVALKGILGIARAATLHSGGDHNRKRIAAAEAAIAKAEGK